MLVPPDVLIDLLIQPEGDLPVNAIHLDAGYKAELFLLRSGDDFRLSALKRRQLVDLSPPLNQVYVHAPDDLILNKVHSCFLNQPPVQAYTRYCQYRRLARCTYRLGVF